MMIQKIFHAGFIIFTVIIFVTPLPGYEVEFEEARQYYEDEEYDEALSILHELSDEYPEKVSVHLLHGHVAFELNLSFLANLHNSLIFNNLINSLGHYNLLATMFL